MTVVVDASVAVQWVLEQERSDSAQHLLDSSRELVAVDLIRLEVRSAILKAVRTKRLPPSDATEAIGTFDRTPVRSFPATDHASAAYAIADRHGGSLYDACYIALARSLDAPLATDDEGMAKIAEAVGVTVHRASQGFADLLD
ncbi:MAG: type II toxin-antitoxin system VapC family toxin [Alphaproteobacteria bacterium]|nr:type II toxin-antitoxin system VapC family toxin [Alphaproteobacteria bacterium]